MPFEDRGKYALQAVFTAEVLFFSSGRSTAERLDQAMSTVASFEFFVQPVCFGQAVCLPLCFFSETVGHRCVSFKRCVYRCFTQAVYAPICDSFKRCVYRCVFKRSMHH